MSEATGPGFADPMINSANDISGGGPRTACYVAWRAPTPASASPMLRIAFSADPPHLAQLRCAPGEGFFRRLA